MDDGVQWSINGEVQAFISSKTYMLLACLTPPWHSSDTLPCFPQLASLPELESELGMDVSACVCVCGGGETVNSAAGHLSCPCNPRICRGRKPSGKQSYSRESRIAGRLA